MILEVILAFIYPGSTAPETMETQDLQHQRRWKLRIYSTRDDGNPGSTAPEAMETQASLVL
jgi:hypothetical protein